MPATQVVTDDARVGAFLASDQETILLTGTFKGLPQVRNWADKYFRYNDTTKFVAAEPFGTGRNAGVKLTKTKAVYYELESRQWGNARELARLQNLLKPR